MKNRGFRERLGFAIEGVRTGWAREALVAGVDAGPGFLRKVGLWR